MSRKKLLLADDSVTIQKVVNLTFADEGIDVITVGDGDTALQAISDEKPDIVLADVNMPGPNGYRICEIVRASEETRFMPVVLLVGSFEPFDEQEAVRVGASAFLTKPFQSIRQLVELVYELIAESATARREETDQSNVSSVNPPQEEPHGAALSSSQPANEVRSEEEDIESLYRLSISEQSGGDFAETFDDLGLDDPTIEMAYGDTSTENAESETAFDDFEEFHEPLSETLLAQTIDDSEEEFFKTLRNEDAETENRETSHEAVTEKLTAEMLTKTQRFFAEENVDQLQNLEAEKEESGQNEENPDEYPLSREPVSLAGTHSQGYVKTPEPELDEVNLLELPPVGVERIVLTTSDKNSGSDSAPTRLIVTVSPELVEQIAERVARILSEKD